MSKFVVKIQFVYNMRYFGCDVIDENKYITIRFVTSKFDVTFECCNFLNFS